MYSYLVLSEYIKSSFIHNLFKKRSNWEKKEKGRVDFLFIQGDKLNRDRNFWSKKAVISNKIDLDTMVINKKNQIHKKVSKHLRIKYLLDQRSIKLGPSFNLSNYKNFFEKYPVGILKPISGYGGKQISIVENYEDFKNTIKPILEEKRADGWSTKKMKKDDFINRLEWVLEEYIINPYLYKGKKFHFRPYFIYYNSEEENKAYLYKKIRIALADAKYKPSDFKNRDIHDSHFVVKDEIEVIYLDDFLSKKNYRKVLDQLVELFTDIAKNLDVQCYKEHNKCFHIFAPDVMLTNDLEIKLLEINTNPGFNLKLNTAGHILENIMYHIIDPNFPSKNEINNPEGFIKL